MLIKAAFSKLSEHKKTIFLLLTVVAGIIILWPLRDFQHYLSQGDHGRDLYAFKAAFEGDLPYRDYWWVYGPLMPYYYGLFYKTLGTNILSILLGQMILKLLSGIFFYCVLATIISPTFSFLGALWFLTFNPDFFYTYNHVGGIAMILATTYNLFRYIKEQKNRYLIWALLSISLLMFIKINFGLTALFCFASTIFTADLVYKNPLTQKKINIYLAAILILPIVTFLIYFLLTRGLPLDTIRQCFPYLPSDHPHNAPLGKSFKFLVMMLSGNLQASWQNISFAFLIMLCVAQTAFLMARKQIAPRLQSQLLLSLGLLALFYIVNLHEFLSRGVLYASFWAKPFSFLAIFIFIATATRKFPFLIRFLLYAALGLTLFMRHTDNISALNRVKQPRQYFALDRGKIFIENHYANWTKPVTEATLFLEQNLREDETFFALPYDPLYYFLTWRKSPTRQLIFFDHINIPPKQEQKIIDELEQKNIQWVLLSSRSNSAEPGLGILGQTYCPLINAYLNKHFEVAAEFGDWDNPPGWAWNHGVRILRKKSSEN